MVLSVKSYQTALRGAYVAETCAYVDYEVGDTSFLVIRVWGMRLDRINCGFTILLWVLDHGGNEGSASEM